MNEKEKEMYINIYYYLLLFTIIYSKFKAVFNAFINIKSNFKPIMILDH